MNRNEEVHENVIAGIVGAFLFSLSGGIIYYLLYMIGIIAGISGLVGVVLAIKGYKLFAKKESVKGVVIASVFALLVIVLAWYLCLGKEIYDAFFVWYNAGEIDYTLTYRECLKAVPIFLKEPEYVEFRNAAIRDLLFSLGFALIGSVGTVVTTIRNIRKKEQLFAGENTAAGKESGLAANGDAESVQEFAAPLRSANTDEKVRVFLKENAFGHEIIFRRVARKTEELVIDGMVYAENKVSGIQFPYEMHVFFDGRRYEAGYGPGLGNYISIDNVVIAKKIRW